jgi:hypothetical protein
MAGTQILGQELVYKQDDGEITAWLTGFEEKMELAHQGSPFYRKVFFLLVLIGFLYLGAIFLLF